MKTIEGKCFGRSYFSSNEKDVDKELQKIIAKEMKYTYVLAINATEYLKITKYLGCMDSDSDVLIGNTNCQSDRIPFQWEITFYTDIDNVADVFDYIESKI